MRLTAFSDYALRLLMYAATQDRLITIEETAQVYKISRGHLMKVANLLTRGGYLTGVRGRSGGLILAKKPQDIRLGDVIRIAEPDFALVECFNSGNQCTITKCCRLPDVLNEALAAFVGTLDRYTLADLICGRAIFRCRFPGPGSGVDPGSGLAAQSTDRRSAAQGLQFFPERSDLLKTGGDIAQDRHQSRNLSLSRAHCCDRELDGNPGPVMPERRYGEQVACAVSALPRRHHLSVPFPMAGP